MIDKLLSEIPISLDFSDVAIQQQKNLCKSRLDAKIDSEVIRGVYIKVPMIAANMSTVTNARFCIEVKKAGGLGVLHRAQPNLETYLDEVALIRSCSTYCAAAVGVGDDQVELGINLI